MKKIKRPLGTKLTIAVMLLAIILAVVAIAFSYSIFSSQVFKYYKDLAANVAKLADDYIDNDKIGTYLETMQKDDDYERMLGDLFKIKENNDIKWLYVEKIDEEKATYIMDADDTEEGCELGEAYDISESFRKQLPSILAGEMQEATISNGEFGWLLTYYYPIIASDGSVAAHVGVDISMDEIVAARARFLILIAAVMLVITLLFVSIYLIYLRRGVIAPLKQVSTAAEDFVSEKERSEDGKTGISKLNIQTGDEIEELSNSIKSMEDNINHYITDLTSLTAEKEHIAAELDVAREIQSSALPCTFPAYPDRTDFDIFASMDTAKAVGGDFYDFFLIDQNKLAVVMADVSGKGIPAALFMMISRTLIKNYALMGYNPAQVFETVNNALCENNEAGMFVTAFMLIYNLEARTVTYVNAGHNKPLLRSTDGVYHWLDSKPCFVLAGMENMKFKEYTIDIHQGDQIYLYTDGVTEAVDTEEELYSDPRLIEKINLPEVRDLGPEELLHYIRKDVDEFANGAEQADDITMLSVRIN